MAQRGTGSPKWPIFVWRESLRAAITLIRTLPVEPLWSFGGGSSLAVQYDHRLSDHVDAFVGSAALRDLSPNRNPATRALLAGRRYEFPGHYLKLHLDGGEIGVLGGTALTADPTRDWVFEGRTLRIDTPVETVMKNLFYRPSTFKVRDVFDAAAVIEREPGKLLDGLPEVEDRLLLVINRVDAMVPAYERLAQDEIPPTETGRRYATRHAAETVRDVLRGWLDCRPPAL